MRSPFAGMDPYLERYWDDIHQRICTYACDALQPQLEPTLLAWLGERLVVEDEGPRTIVPDVRVTDPQGGTAVLAGRAIGEHEPILIRVVGNESRREAFIQITDPTDGDRLVTVIELLSLSNKRSGDGQRRYRQKQRECREAGVSLVEINLLREGPWVLQVPFSNVPAENREPCAACVHRGWMDDLFELYPMPITGPLQKIRVPLRRGDADAVLDLQALIEATYANSAVSRKVNYARDAEPPLTGDAAAWADELLRKAGRRPPIT